MKPSSTRRRKDAKKPMDRLFFLSHHLNADGYGYAGFKMREALQHLGVDVVAVDMVQRPDDPFAPFGARTWVVRGPALALCVPEWWRDMVARGPLYGFTMFESTKMPAGRVEAINDTAAMCLVPCEWCAETFAAQGVTAPVRVVHWGTEAADWWFVERDTRRPFTFLWSGTPDYRKGWDLVYRAFIAAFKGRADVRLRLHFRDQPVMMSGVGDSNVEMVVGRLSRAELRQMLQDADCFVFPSRGEGWGMPPREAAATGLPAIVTNWGGLAVELEHWALPVEVRGLVPAWFGGWKRGSIGEWAEPHLEHLIHQMRWVVENREDAAQFGQEASAWLAEHAGWERTAAGIVEAVAAV